MVNDQHNELQPDSGKRKLIEKATGAEFNQSYAETIAKNFRKLLQPEVDLAQSQSPLYTIPFSAKADLPKLDEDTNAIMVKKWQEFHQRYIDPNRFMTPTANSWENHTTWLKFDAHLQPFQRGLWTLYTIYLDGIHIPLNIENNFDKASVKPKRELLSDDDVERLVLALMNVFKGEQTEADQADSRRIFKRDRKQRQMSEAMALNLLTNQPQEFVNFFQPDKMKVFPDRLMSNKEMDTWLNMVNEVFRLGKSQRVIIGHPGYGSYQEYEALFQFGLDTPVLKQTHLHSSGEKQGNFSTLFPIQVKEKDHTLGWTICNISRHPQMPEPAVSFDHHGTGDLYYFELARTKKFN